VEEDEVSMILRNKGRGIWRLPLVVGTLVLAACGGDATPGPEASPAVKGEPPTLFDLFGIWLQVEDTSNLGVLVRFSSGSSFAMDDRGQLGTSPAAAGEFDLDGNAITFTSEGSDLCTEGDSWAWRASVLEGLRLHVVHTEEAAGPCRIPAGTEWTLIRVSPGSPDSIALTVEEPAEGPSPTATDLAGVWLRVAPSSDVLIRFSPDGRFAIDNHGELDTAPAIVGTYKLDGRLITIKVGSSSVCSAGDSWTWRASLPEDGRLDTLVTEAGTGNCFDPPGTEWTFVRVSPSSAASTEATSEITAAGTSG
jgi:hypothetical protein